VNAEWTNTSGFIINEETSTVKAIKLVVWQIHAVTELLGANVKLLYVGDWSFTERSIRALAIEEHSVT
jgi:hypothetical protein